VVAVRGVQPVPDAPALDVPDRNDPAFTHGLWCHNLWRAYAGVPALRGLSLTVAPGEVVGLLGPNGAGKSTALRLMCGLARADQGEAWLGGVDVLADPLRARERLGFLAQDTLLYARHTVWETLLLFARLHGLSPAAAQASATSWVERLHLAPLLQRMVGTLSSGERQRANLARTLLHDPKVLILDEPTTALDPETVDLLLTVIRQLRAEGRAILLCTHALADAELVVDRAVLIHAGATVAQGTLAQLLAQTGTNTLTSAFLTVVRAQVALAAGVNAGHGSPPPH
jgi:ABC-type multidrug transport system ATPase subunit